MEKKSRVYVVDDDPDVRQALVRLLRTNGHDAIAFASAMAFMDFQLSRASACLVLDMKMPNMSGLELQDQMVEKGISVPIIFITAHGTIPDTVKALKAGAVDFLEKPFEEKQLLEGIFPSHRNTSGFIGKEPAAKKTSCQTGYVDTERTRSFSSRGTRDAEQTNCLRSRDNRRDRQGASGRLNIQKMGAESLADLVRFAEKLGTLSSSTS